MGMMCNNKGSGEGKIQKKSEDKRSIRSKRLANERDSIKQRIIIIEEKNFSLDFESENSSGLEPYLNTTTITKQMK